MRAVIISTNLSQKACFGPSSKAALERKPAFLESSADRPLIQSATETVPHLSKSRHESPPDPAPSLLKAARAEGYSAHGDLDSQHL